MGAVNSAIPSFAGRWVLDGTDYQFGKGPIAGSYTIALGADGAIDITATSLGAHGRQRRITFHGILDGGPFPYHSTNIADHLAFYRVSDRVIRSEAFKDGHRIHWATRTLSADGMRFTIQVYGRRADGSIYCNTDYYHRAAGASPGM